MSERRLTAELERGRIVVKDPAAISELVRKGHYGIRSEDGVLELSPVEALYLVDLGKLEVREGDRVLSFEELIRRLSREDPDIWLRYVIYSDLRRRGFVVRPAPSRRVCFRLYDRGADPDYEAARYLVYGVVEGSRVDFKELARMIEEARRARKELVLAVVDRQGEVAYYSVSTVSL